MEKPDFNNNRSITNGPGKFFVFQIDTNGMSCILFPPDIN